MGQLNGQAVAPLGCHLLCRSRAQSDLDRQRIGAEIQRIGVEIGGLDDRVGPEGRRARLVGTFSETIRVVSHAAGEHVVAAAAVERVVAALAEEMVVTRLAQQDVPFGTVGAIDGVVAVAT